MPISAPDSIWSGFGHSVNEVTRRWTEPHFARDPLGNLFSTGLTPRFENPTTALHYVGLFIHKTMTAGKHQLARIFAWALGQLHFLSFLTILRRRGGGRVELAVQKSNIQKRMQEKQFEQSWRLFCFHGLKSWNQGVSSQADCKALYEWESSHKSLKKQPQLLFWWNWSVPTTTSL